MCTELCNRAGWERGLMNIPGRLPLWAGAPVCWNSGEMRSLQPTAWMNPPLNLYWWVLISFDTGSTHTYLSDTCTPGSNHRLPCARAGAECRERETCFPVHECTWMIERKCLHITDQLSRSKDNPGRRSLPYTLRQSILSSVLYMARWLARKLLKNLPEWVI